MASAHSCPYRAAIVRHLQPRQTRPAAVPSLVDCVPLLCGALSSGASASAYQLALEHCLRLSHSARKHLHRTPAPCRSDLNWPLRSRVALVTVWPFLHLWLLKVKEVHAYKPRFTCAALPCTRSCAFAQTQTHTHMLHAGSGESGSADSVNRSAPPGHVPTLAGHLSTPSDPQPPNLSVETSTESAEPSEAEDADEPVRPTMRASWPQLQEIGRLLERRRPRKVVTRSGRSVVSWQARTGEGKEVQMQTRDPGELLEAFKRERRDGGRGSGDSGDAANIPWALMPSEWSIRQLARQLQAKSGLRLFNLDVICPVGQAGRQHVGYRVVDINYFPGFDKLPQFEDKFVDFLVACGREAAGAGAASQGEP